ncbi:MAG: zinc-binding dehydrogenase [Thiotrichales bacterium]
MLRANGCRVLGIDFDTRKCELARQFGAETVDLSKGEDPVTVAQGFSPGRGVDGVVVTAASRSDEIMHQAAEMCRKRGRINNCKSTRALYPEMRFAAKPPSP